MTDNEVYEIIPDCGEFNARDVNVILCERWESFSNNSVDTEAILNRLRSAGKVMRSSGEHCYWYVKK